MTVPASLSSVPDVSPYIQYIASSGQTVFPYPFPITQDADLVVVVSGVTQSTDSGYSVSGVGVTGGGNVTFTLGQSAGAIITLYRDIQIERISQIAQNSGFSSTVFNNEFNNFFLIAQQLQASIAQCLQIPNTNNPVPVTTLTPAAYAGYYLSFDTHGNPQPATLTSSGSLTQAIIAGLLTPQTAAELSAGVTPSSNVYPPLNPFRDGADGLGGANDETAWAKVRSVIAQCSNMALWQNLLSIGGWMQSAAEAAVSFLGNFLYPSDSSGKLSVFRFMTQAQIAAVQGGANTVDVSAAVQAANDFLEGGALGGILSLTLSGAMSGYTNGFYPNVSMSGGSGQFAYCAVTVAGGVITSIVPAGAYHLNSSGVATGLANTHTTNASGQSYLASDTLTLVTNNSAASPQYFPTGGSGAVIKVATVTTTRGKTASGLPPGGTLFFPPGYYYYGTSDLRVGAFVAWEMNSQGSVSHNWASGYTGNGVYLGPDNSGFNGWSSYYTMGSQLRHFTANMSVGQLWSVYTTGAQQGCIVDDFLITGVAAANGGAMFLQDHKGSVGVKISNGYVYGNGNTSETTRAFVLDGFACAEVNNVSANGGGSTNRFLAAVAVVSGGALIYNLETELSITGLDIAGTAGESTVTLINPTITPAGTGTVQCIWIHSGYTGTVVVNAPATGPGWVLVRNDNTNEQRAAAGAGGLMGQYVWSGTSTDYSVLHNTIVRPPVLAVNASGSQSLDITGNQAFDVSQGVSGGWTMAAPTMGVNAMPTAGICRPRILINILNDSGSTITTSWASVFALAGTWTDPANGKQRSVEFLWNGTKWHELFRSAADVTT